MSAPHLFEVDGLSFELEQLELPDACRGARLVTDLAGSLLSKPNWGPGEIALAVGQTVDRLPELIDLFAPCCKVEGGEFAQGRKVALKPFVKDAFKGHLDRAVLFVANCIAAEFGDFLEGGLDRLQAGLEDLVRRHPSLKARMPSSGA